MPTQHAVQPGVPSKGAGNHAYTVIYLPNVAPSGIGGNCSCGEAGLIHDTQQRVGLTEHK